MQPSIVWLGDAPPELPDPQPDLRLNNLNNDEKSLPRYEFGIGGIICDTIINSGAGSVYLDLSVTQELYKWKEINVIHIVPRNVRLANGHVKRINKKAKFMLHIGNNKTQMEVYLINLPEMDLILGLPWLCLTQAVPDYDDLSYSFIDHTGKAVYVHPYNKIGPSKGELNILLDGSNDNISDFEKITYATAPDSFREMMGLPKEREFEHDIDTGNVATVKVHG